MKFFEWQLVRCRACINQGSGVGQVDAEKLAQRSSVAAFAITLQLLFILISVIKYVLP
jgi:hypothetical protein